MYGAGSSATMMDHARNASAHEAREDRIVHTSSFIMRATDAMGPACAGAVADEAKRLGKRLRRARRGEVEGVHKSRTSIRRLEVALWTLGRVAPGQAGIGRLDRKI